MREYINSLIIIPFNNLWRNNFYKPILSIINQIFVSSSLKDEHVVSYKMEKEILLQMISDYDDNDNSMELIMNSYARDIQTPISSIIRGKLLTSIFIQIQSLKVSISSLLINVDNIIDSNRINMEILATIPAISCFYFLYKIFYLNYNNKSLNSKLNLRQKSKKEIRFIFR